MEVIPVCCHNTVCPFTVVKKPIGKDVRAKINNDRGHNRRRDRQTDIRTIRATLTTSRKFYAKNPFLPEGYIPRFRSLAASFHGQCSFITLHLVFFLLLRNPLGYRQSLFDVRASVCARNFQLIISGATHF